MPQLDEVIPWHVPSRTVTLQYRNSAMPLLPQPYAPSHMPVQTSVSPSPTLSSPRCSPSSSSDESGQQLSTATVVARTSKRSDGLKKRSASPTSDDSYCDVCDCEATSCKAPPKHAKLRKERKSRKLQGDQQRVQEECVLFVSEVPLQNSQSRGNGKSAGLRNVKIATQKIANALLQHRMGDARIEAMKRPGGLEEFVAENIRIAHDALLPGPLHRGPFINLTDDTCEMMDEKSTVCKSHKNPDIDFLTCRENLVRANFLQNVQLQEDKISKERQAETRRDSHL